MNDNIEDIKKQAQEFIDKIQTGEGNLTVEDINRHMAQVTQAKNTAPRSAFNGFSSEQMTKMLYFPLEPGCPVQLRSLTEKEIEKIPFMRQTLHLMDALNQKEIKLTQKGSLPVKMVETLYDLGDKPWNLDWVKTKTEEKISEVRTVRAILRETCLTKVRLGKLSLTTKGKKLLSDHNELLRTHLLFLFTQFHTGWNDRLEDFKMANMGRLCSLWLLHHYGSEWRNVMFYADEYFNAFPKLKRETTNKYIVYEEFYTNRIFHSLFLFIGLCELRECKDPITERPIEEVRKKPLLDMMFSFKEPSQIQQ